MSSDEAFVTELLRALDEVGLEAIIVGSVAAIMQGAPITTRDVALLVCDTPLNRQKIEALGKSLGNARAIERSPVSRVLTFLGTRVPVDVIFDALSGELTFASIRSRSVKVSLGEQTAVIASLEDIIRSKEAAGRAKDLAQLPILRDTLRVRAALKASE